MPHVGAAHLKTTDFPDLHSEEELPLKLVCVNAPELSQFAAEAGNGFFADRYTIGFWAWETIWSPPAGTRSFSLVDENLGVFKLRG